MATATDNTITGNMATINIDLNIEKITHEDENRGGIIPMSNNMVEVAINNNCIDNNGNAVCQIYKITTTNTGSINLFVDGYITLTGGSGEPADYTPTKNNTTIRWAQVFCEEDANCTTVGTTTTGATGIDTFTTLDNQTDTTGLNQDNIKTTYEDTTTQGTIQNKSYDIINKNYIRTSDHKATSTNYKRNKDVTSALVYNQYLDSSTGTNPSSKYYFVVWLSETGHNQTEIITDKFFGGIVTFTTNSGNVTGTFGNFTEVSTNKGIGTDYIKNLYNNNNEINTVHIGGVDTNPIVSLNPKTGIMLDNNNIYRYYGPNPNNYVEFNDELWRIVSVGKVYSNTSDTEGSTRIKIIRNESIGEYSFNGQKGYEYVTSYSRSNVKDILNNAYYNALDNQTCYIEHIQTEIHNFSNIGLSTTSKQQIDTATWHTGFMYSNYPNQSFDSEIQQTWLGNIGLLPASDYGYATNLSLCTKTLTYYTDTTCKNNNWLFFANSSWLITPTSSNWPGVITKYGGTYNGQGSYKVYNAMKVYPTVYLKPNIEILEGSGTPSDPYILSET